MDVCFPLFNKVKKYKNLSPQLHSKEVVELGEDSRTYMRVQYSEVCDIRKNSEKQNQTKKQE